MKQNKVIKILFSFLFVSFFIQACGDKSLLPPASKDVADVKINVIDKKFQKPVPNASISLKNGEEQFGKVQITDDNGQTTFKDIPLGDGYVAFINKAVGYKSAASPVIKVVPNSETNVLLDRIGDGDGSGLIAGSVKDKQTKLPISRLTVTYVGPKTNKSLMTDENGSFVIEGLVAGNYNLTFSKIGYTRIQKTVPVQDGQTANVETVFLNRQGTTSSVGNFLVSLNGSSKAVELNSTGKVLWSYDKLGSIESSVRTNNGDTIVTDSNSSRIVQISNGGTVKTLGTGTFISSLKYPTWVDSVDGQNVLITDNGANKISEYNGTNQVWSYSTALNRPRSAVYLSNGNILITDTGNRRVIEINKSGNIIWSFDKSMDKPVHAIRIANGNTLITDLGYSRIIEVNFKGQVVWWFAGPQGGTSPNTGDQSGTGIIPNTGDDSSSTSPEDGLDDMDIASNKKANISSEYGAYGGEETPSAPGNTLLFPRSASKLSNGDILIADTGNNRIVQVSKDKKIVWQLGNLPRPVSVERL
jgi:hypothetical protein